jgi:hypothetical protein
MSTYTPIASQTLSSAAASVTFSSIPQGYTDLIIVVNAGASVATANGSIRFNEDTGNNYSQTTLRGNGSAAASASLANISQINLDYYGFTTSLTNLEIIQVQNYSNSTTNKTVLIRGDSADYGVRAVVGLWRNTSAITRIDIKSDAYNFITGSTFSIYGIQVGQAAQKAQGGNIVTTDGTYVYHTFTSSGAFIPSEALTVDYLIVAGGGGGGEFGGGGGAGGLRSTVTATGGGGSLESPLSLTAQAYTVTIGAGGAGGSTATPKRGVSGSNSVFSTITSTGGGGGGNGQSAADNPGLSGGSGGGGGGDSAGQVGGATSPAGQGFAGGTSALSGSGGGGGGSAVGSAGTTSNGGAGGAGTATSISGTSTTYAGGGGGRGNVSGGAGGAGGGGNAGTSGVGTAGTVNTGGGAGGGSTGGNGGSGIVIIRYAI